MSREFAAVAALAIGLAVAVVLVPRPSRQPSASGEVALAQDGILALPGAWTDQDGRARTLADLRGRVLVVSMVFTRCASACPRTVGDLRAIVAALPDEQRADVGVLLVSFDSARDDPATLQAFARERGLTPDVWTLLRGEPDDVRALAAALGVRYRPAGGGFAHSNLITVLDRAGRIAHQVEGLGVEPSAVLPGIARALAQVEPGPSQTLVTEQRP